MESKNILYIEIKIHFFNVCSKKYGQKCLRSKMFYKNEKNSGMIQIYAFQ
jgi:hypothetical protein